MAIVPNSAVDTDCFVVIGIGIEQSVGRSEEGEGIQDNYYGHDRSRTGGYLREEGRGWVVVIMVMAPNLPTRITAAVSAQQ